MIEQLAMITAHTVSGHKIIVGRNVKGLTIAIEGPELSVQKRQMIVGAIASITGLKLENHSALKMLLNQRLDSYRLWNTRTSNGFQNNRLSYFGELVVLDRKQLLKMKNFGEKSLNELEGILASMGLSLEMDIGDWKPPTG